MFKEKEKFYENKLWHLGDVYKLKQFYRNLSESLEESKTKQFYALTEDVDRVIHNGVATNITDSITDLIGVDSATIESKENADKYKDEIKDVYIDHDLLEKYENAIEYLTWGKEAFAKLSVVDGEVDVEIIDTLKGRKLKQRGKIVAYEFIVKINEECTERTIERYGKGYITTILQERDEKSGEWLDVNKSTIVFPTEEILATHLEISRDAYSQSVTMFDAIDETESRMTDEARKGRMFRFMDEKLIPTDENGKKISVAGTAIENFIKLKGMKTEDGKPLIDYMMADIDPEKRYIKAKHENIKTVVRNAGLSWHTFDGGEIASGMSAEAQRELEKTSIRTRRKYIHRLKPFMAKVMSLIFFLEKTLGEPVPLNEETSEQEIGLQENDYQFVVTFDDYIQNSLDARVKTWGSQEAQSNFPVAYRIEKVLEGEVPAEEIAKLVTESKNEQGIEQVAPVIPEED